MLEKLCTPLSAAASEEITLTTPQHHHQVPSDQNEAVNNIAGIPDEVKLEEDESTKTKEKERKIITMAALISIEEETLNN